MANGNSVLRLVSDRHLGDAPADVICPLSRVPLFWYENSRWPLVDRSAIHHQRRVEGFDEYRRDATLLASSSDRVDMVHPRRDSNLVLCYKLEVILTFIDFPSGLSASWQSPIRFRRGKVLFGIQLRTSTFGSQQHISLLSTSSSTPRCLFALPDLERLLLVCHHAYGHAGPLVTGCDAYRHPHHHRQYSSISVHLQSSAVAYADVSRAESSGRRSGCRRRDPRMRARPDIQLFQALPYRPQGL